MIPAAFVIVDAIPLTPNGKVDQRALPAPDIENIGLQETYVAPRTPIEHTLVAIWTEVLSLERVGVHDNFFELGGHSLLATQVISRVQNTLGIELPLRTLFETSDIADLAEVIVMKQMEGFDDEVLEQMLLEAEALSDEEIARQLFHEA
jgi:acyl carrier protein